MKQHKWIIHIWLLAAVVILLFGMPSTCNAESAKEGQKTVRVAFPLIPGIGNKDESGLYSGYDYDYLEKVAEFTGWNYEYVTFEGMSSDEAIIKSMEMVQNGEVDLMGSTLRSDQLETMYEFSKNNYGAVYTSLSVLEDNPDINETNFMAVQPLRVAVIAKATTRIAELTKYLDEAKASYELVECGTVGEQYQKLLDGEADAMLRVTLSFQPGTRQIATFAPRPYYFISDKGNTELIEELDQAILSINQTFPYFQSDIFEEYFGNTSGKFTISDAEQEYTDKKKEIKVLCVPDCAPYVYTEKNGTPGGIAVSIMNDFAEQTGLSVDYEIYDGSQSFYTTFTEGEYDCVLGIPVNSEYNAVCGIVTSTPYMTTELVSFNKKNNLDMKDQDRVVALIRGSEMADYIKCKKIIYYDTIKECIQAVNNGTADTGYGDSRCVEYYCNDVYADLVIIPYAGKTDDLSISIARETTESFIRLVNKYIDNLDENSLYSYYAETNMSLQKNGIEEFARNNPVTSIFIAAALISAILGCIGMYYILMAIRIKNAELQRAYAAKNIFLSRMSHDMRTPMNAVIGMSELGIQDAEDEDLQNYFVKIKKSGDYLLGLINDTLDMSKIDSDKMTLHPETYFQQDFIDSISQIMIPCAEKKGVEFKIYVKGEMTRAAYVDKLRLQQIFVNLLNNAVKFTPEGGRVEFEIQNPRDIQGTSNIYFYVRDTGVGISPEFQKKMFQPFEQENSLAADMDGGTGLGLSIVKSLVELMGGHIECKSTQGRGTEFMVTIPMQIMNLIEKDERAHRKDPVGEVDLEGKRILVCEDHPINTEITKKILKKKGMLVETAADGALGVQMFTDSAEHYYDAVLMDIRMPVMDGIEATKVIRAMKRADAGTIPIIAMTANVFAEDIQKSAECGMNAHLAKPIDMEQLYLTLKKCLQ